MGLPTPNLLSYQGWWYHACTKSEYKMIIHIMRSSVESMIGPQAGPKMAGDSREGWLVWHFMVVKGWEFLHMGPCMAWTFHKCEGREHPGFLTKLPRHEAESYWCNWKAVSSQIWKRSHTPYYTEIGRINNASNYLIYGRDTLYIQTQIGWE